MALRLVSLIFAFVFSTHAMAFERPSDIIKFRSDVSQIIRDSCVAKHLAEAGIKIDTALDSAEMHQRWPDYTYAFDDMFEDPTGYLITLKFSFREHEMRPITVIRTPKETTFQDEGLK